MSKLYLFAIGGTGSRVVKSLVMLLSAGVEINVSEIRLLIIDPDRAGGDVSRTSNLLQSYQRIYDDLRQISGFSNRFCSTPIVPALPTGFFVTGVEALDRDGRGAARDERGLTLSEAFNEHDMSLENQALFQALYSDVERADTLTVGSKGRQHVGAIEFMKFLGSEGFKSIFTDFTAGTDRIFVVSSVFGGTGASAFPLIMKAFFTGLNNEVSAAQAIKEAPKGAMVLFPYFKVDPSAESSIDSRTFNKKMLTSLHYYDKNLNFGIAENQLSDDKTNCQNVIYYLGDYEQRTYQNYEGGALQKNDAHLLEFLAATGIVDFAALDDFTSHAREYGMAGKLDSRSVTFRELDVSTYNLVARPMTQFLLMLNYFKAVNFRTCAWYQDSELGSVFQTPFYKELDKLGVFYREWLSEMERNTRAFMPFNLDMPGDFPFSIVMGIEERKKIRGYEKFNHVLNKTKVSTQRGLPLALLELFWSATRQMVQGKDAFIQF